MTPRVAIVGGGIGGLALALLLHQRRIPCTIHESAREVRELGVGITLLPHGMRELRALGLEDALRAVAIENEESVFFNRHGQLVYREARGRFAGYDVPELGIHRGKLHRVLYDAVIERLGPGVLQLDHECVAVEEGAGGAIVRLARHSTGERLPSDHADVAVACDGINSSVRRQFYPHERLAFTGINTWRGITRHAPILTGRSYLRIGTVETGKIVIYPIVDRVDPQGRQLVNWMAEKRQPGGAMNDWNKPGRVDDFIDIYRDWRFDFLDVPEMIRRADVILEYPMVDRDPVERWTFGHVTLMGDAAHPMYPRGSQGSAQALIDARTLADELAKGGDPAEALRAYEAARLAPTARVTRTNREHPPDFIITKVEELTHGERFERLEDYISQAELKAMSDEYKRVAGFSLPAARG